MTLKTSYHRRAKKYLDFLFEEPDEKGKITTKKKGDAIYVNYEVGREYYPDRQYTIPKRVTIGKLSKADKRMMVPNQNFLTYFPEVELPEEKFNSNRSSCLKIGPYIVIQKILEEYRIPELLEQQFDGKDLGLFLDLMAYSITCENNAGQYYPMYAYGHPLFTEGMRIYSDTKVSDFLCGMSGEESIGFLNDWNSTCDHREKIYISYDSTNKNSEAGNIEMVEFGEAKVDVGAPIFNYSIAYDTKNAKPLFYETYLGSIADISQLEFMLGKAKGYGYKNIGFILDRGYFSKGNIRKMDEYGYSFVIMVKGMAKLVNTLVLKNKGRFEEERKYSIRKHHVYGFTVKSKLYLDDEKDRYFHIYHSTGKEHGEKEELEEMLERLGKSLRAQYGTDYQLSDAEKEYFDTFYDSHGILTLVKEKDDAIKRALQLCGYFCIVTSDKMTAAEAIDLYYSRDASEKLFRGDKSYLGNKSERTHYTESTEAKIFVEFVALIVRNRIYTRLKEELERIDEKPNYMTVPAAIRELEKIEMIRGHDQVYRLDHAVTKTQKTILNAFGMDAAYVKHRAQRISEQLKIADEGGR
ncbi:MAG: transposase [Erysipelotrichaceae bacterium]|nr:transposase [Erysipelotrichaceae bacterium]